VRREAQAERRLEQARGRIQRGASPARIESPVVHRPEGVGTAGGKGRKAGAKQRRHNPQVDCRRAGERDASPGNRSRGPYGQSAQAGGNGRSKACQRAASDEGAETRVNAPDRGRPEGRPEGKAGDDGLIPDVKRRSLKAAGGLSGSKGRKL
jgi:hypothetical protein